MVGQIEAVKARHHMEIFKSMFEKSTKRHEMALAIKYGHRARMLHQRIDQLEKRIERHVDPVNLEKEYKTAKREVWELDRTIEQFKKDVEKEIELVFDLMTRLYIELDTARAESSNVQRALYRLAKVQDVTVRSKPLEGKEPDVRELSLESIRTKAKIETVRINTLLHMIHTKADKLKNIAFNLRARTELSESARS